MIAQDRLYDPYLITYTLYVIIDRQISSLNFKSDRMV